MPVTNRTDVHVCQGIRGTAAGATTSLNTFAVPNLHIGILEHAPSRAFTAIVWVRLFKVCLIHIALPRRTLELSRAAKQRRIE